jgi:hypothetical protein
MGRHETSEGTDTPVLNVTRVVAQRTYVVERCQVGKAKPRFVGYTEYGVVTTNPSDLLQELAGLGQMLQHLKAQDGFHRPVAEREGESISLDLLAGAAGR